MNDHNPYFKLITVLDGDVGNGYVEHRGHRIQKRDSRRNLWDVRVGGTIVETFDADKFTSTSQLGFYLDLRLAQHGADVPLPEGVDPAETDAPTPGGASPTGFQ